MGSQIYPNTWAKWYLDSSESHLKCLYVMELVPTAADAVFQSWQFSVDVDTVDMQRIDLLTVVLLWAGHQLQTTPVSYDVCNQQASK